MPRKHSKPSEIFDYVTTCRQSGLTDRQWCINNGIPQSTFYTWLKKLRTNACFEVPDSLAKLPESTIPTCQDVVRVNIVPDCEPEYMLSHPTTSLAFNNEHSDITITFEGIHIGIKNTVDPHVLADTLKLMRTFLC